MYTLVILDALTKECSISYFHVLSPGLSAYPERRAVVDFSLPIYYYEYSIAIKNPKFEIEMWNYLSPFYFESWVVILMLIGVASLCLAMACKFSIGNIAGTTGALGVPGARKVSTSTDF